LTRDRIEVPAYEHGKPRFDIAALLLALAFRDDVFIGINSTAVLWEFRVPKGEPLLGLQMYSLKLDLPVLRKVTRHRGLPLHVSSPSGVKCESSLELARRG
jgi:hypothetical protein